MLVSLIGRVMMELVLEWRLTRMWSKFWLRLSYVSHIIKVSWLV